MFCSECGKEIADNAKFCWNCGAKVARIEEIAEKVSKEEETKTEVVVSEDQIKEIRNKYNYEDLPTKKETGIHSIYFIDFIIRMAQKANIPLLIYLIINVVIIGLIATLFCQLPVGWGLLVGLLVYIGSVSIALSPIGEFMVRRQTGCKKIEDMATIQRLEPLFREVYYKAKKEDPTISEDVRLFINENECPNAFATGRKTMCVTRGLLQLSDDQIKATLAHEFGHLAHKDTDRVLIVTVGNAVITIIMWLFQIGAIIMEWIMHVVGIMTGDDEGFFMMLIGTISRVFTIVLIDTLMKIWSGIGTLLVMKTSRGNEYQADAFAVDLGFAEGLVKLLNFFDSCEDKPTGLFANLASSHPTSDKRIAKVLEYQTSKMEVSNS